LRGDLSQQGDHDLLEHQQHHLLVLLQHEHVIVCQDEGHEQVQNLHCLREQIHFFEQEQKQLLRRKEQSEVGLHREFEPWCD
jgi:hypothetical protein